MQLVHTECDTVQAKSAVVVARHHGRNTFTEQGSGCWTMKCLRWTKELWQFRREYLFDQAQHLAITPEQVVAAPQISLLVAIEFFGKIWVCSSLYFHNFTKKFCPASAQRRPYRLLAIFETLFDRVRIPPTASVAQPLPRFILQPHLSSNKRCLYLYNTRRSAIIFILIYIRHR